MINWNSLITEENQMASFTEIQFSKLKKEMQVYLILLEKPRTASEVAQELYNRGAAYSNHRAVASPRLTEMANDGEIEVCGSKRNPITKRNEAIWRVIENGGENQV